MTECDCIRCGKCCYIYVKGEKPYKCRFLLKNNNTGKTYCRVYNNRIGLKVSLLKRFESYRCTPRILTPWDYPGCPLNTGKPIIE